jgi:hypothetical protein
MRHVNVFMLALLKAQERIEHGRVCGMGGCVP